MVIDIEGKELKVIAESVHDMLGLPIGGTKLTQLDRWPKDDTSYDEWKQQFKKDSIIRLSLFYADNIHSEALTVTRKRPTICYWSLEKIRYREAFEQEKGKFGLGEINEEFVDEQDEGDTDLEDNDYDKDEDHFVEAYESKISKMINSFERMKEKLNSKLNDAMTKFLEKESFRIFNEKMTNMIVEEKTESTTLFNFPINETGVEGINLTPIMGQKTNDKTENEDKEGNGEEDSDNGASQPEVDYLLNSNEADNEEIKNDADKNKKEGEIGVKEKDGKRNENENDEEEKDDYAEETNNHEETIRQTENENLLDKVVHNIVDNVLGIGISTLNSQEDEIWNPPEMKAIFDNIDIGSPMSTGKANTLAENEKSEGVHKQGTKVEKTKEDDIDRNEGGTEAKNTKDGGEEKHIETEKGNAEDKGKKQSENENKKDTHPSFSLGLSQHSDQTSSKKSNESSPKKALTKKEIKDDHQKVVIRLAKKNVLNPNPISVSIPTKVGPSKHDLDQPREKKLADAFKSPFKCRITDTKPKLTHQESIVCE
ncbi:unnamed protein product [Lactuca saligna]|uniref:Uncharacterized protein n=1 Tax=Lactuca saligna TaxID=75948 RepID=A0AA35VGQ3_LACSI|nr:unnamed protein product [Lactuca saligna]